MSYSLCEEKIWKYVLYKRAAYLSTCMALEYWIPTNPPPPPSIKKKVNDDCCVFRFSHGKSLLMAILF